MKGIQIHIVGTNEDANARVREFIQTALKNGLANDPTNAHHRFHGIRFETHIHMPGHSQPLKVLANPLEVKGSMPWIKYAPGNGWSVYDTQTKGCHCPELKDAVADYNANIERKLAALNVSGYKKRSFNVHELPGFETAQKDRLQHIAKTETAKGHEAGTAARQETATQARERIHETEAKRGPGKTRHPMLGLIAMAAALGAFSGPDEEPETVMDEPLCPECLSLLIKARLAHPSPDGIMVAVPREHGEQWVADVEDAMRGANPVKLRTLLVSAGLL